MHTPPAGGGCSRQFAAGELRLSLLEPPYSNWTSAPARYVPDSKPSSVARVEPEPLNLNGTMNHDPNQPRLRTRITTCF